MPSRWIVERLDVFRDRGAGDRAILVDLLLDVLLFQTCSTLSMSAIRLDDIGQLCVLA